MPVKLAVTYSWATGVSGGFSANYLGLTLLLSSICEILAFTSEIFTTLLLQKSQLWQHIPIINYGPNTKGGKKGGKFEPRWGKMNNLRNRFWIAAIGVM